MIFSFASRIVLWLIPPACGALVGGALGYFVLGRFILSRLLRNRSAITRVTTVGVDVLTRWALALRVGDLAPDRHSPAAAALEQAIGKSLGGVLRSRASIYAVRDLVSQIISGLVARKVSELSREIGFPGLISEKLLPALARENSRQAVARAAGSLVAAQAGRALGDDVLHEISGVFESYVPEAADALVRWLRSGETRAYLSERGRELLPRILETLSDLQKLFISAGQFDRRLDEKMPEIVDETIVAAEKMVRDQRQQERIAALFFESAQGWRDSLLVSPAGTSSQRNDPRQKLADSASALLNRLLERMEDEQTRNDIAGLTEERLRLDHRTLGAFIGDIFGIRDSDIIDALSASTLKFLTRPGTAHSIARQICGLLFDFVEENAKATIGEALQINEARKRSVDEHLRARAQDFFPEISETITGSILQGRLFMVTGAAMGLVIGLVLMFLRLLGYH
ncbi:MAG: hypothetical protein ABSG21_02430 [Spirochaetia bacterium]